MKKILLLGGSAQQVPAIKYAKKEGYFTILCDYLVDNPGQKYADRFYLESTTDKEKILEISKKEKIDGIIAYASDPAAATAAYVSEKLSLPTNPYESVLILSNKKLFRNFLKENKFNVPNTITVDNYSKLSIEKFSFPLIVKPTDSSGSKGITMVYEENSLKASFDKAMESSKEKLVLVEEYIEKSHEFLVGGDIFIMDGKIQTLGLLNCHRDEKVNELVPVGKSYPLNLEKSKIEKIRNNLNKIIDILDLKFGGFNVELIFDKNDNLYFIEIGPRSGGNMIPELLTLITDVNMMELTIDKIMKKSLEIPMFSENKYYATHNIHSDKTGVLDSIVFTAEIEKYIIKKNIYVKKGDMVEFFDSANKALGIIFMKFESKEAMEKLLKIINSHIKIKVRK